MDERMNEELELLRTRFEGVDFLVAGRWVRLSAVPTGPGWAPSEVPVAFQVPPGYPGTPPYGFYVPATVTHEGRQPKNSQCPPSVAPPFEGDWMMLSWTQAGNWRATADLVRGSNLLNWALSFRDRFSEGA